MLFVKVGHISTEQALQEKRTETTNYYTRGRKKCQRVHSSDDAVDLNQGAVEVMLVVVRGSDVLNKLLLWNPRRTREFIQCRG